MADATATGDEVTTLPPANPTAPPVKPPELDPDVKAAIGVFIIQTIAASAVAQQNFITLNKMIDFDFMENRRSVSPEEAVGLKELNNTPPPAKP